MTEYSIKRLALTLALQAEIEGMKAENFDKGYNVFGNEDFRQKADELRTLAYKHDDQL